jgi:hypothetical protein
MTRLDEIDAANGEPVPRPNFCSFWPPSFTGCYQISWVVESERITGLRFADQASVAHFVGRYIT